MIADLKPYPEYRASGLPWLGSVPRHWDLVPTRHLFRQVVRQDFNGDEHKMSMSRQFGLVRSATLTGRVTTAATSVAFSVCHAGDLVMNKYQAHNGLFGCATERGLITANYSVFAPASNGITDYYSLLYASAAYRTLFLLECRGVGDGMMPLYSSAFGRVPSITPPPAEQAAIVRFLNWTNSRLKRTIRAKRKVIVLLSEQRQAIIHRAVVCGLNSAASLKPSGIPGVGDIPEHWEAIRICRLFKQVTRYIAHGSEPKMSMSRRYGLIRSDQLSNRAAQAATSIRFSVCLPGDLIVNKYQAHNGLFGAATERGLITSNYSVFEPTRKVVTKYFALLFASPIYRAEFRMRCQGVGDGMMPLYSDAFLKTYTIAPPVIEQRSIVEFIDDATSDIAQAISRLEREIDLLLEYQARLVADVVTGKLDVREVATRLSDEAELETLEGDTDLGEEIEAIGEEAPA